MKACTLLLLCAATAYGNDNVGLGLIGIQDGNTTRIGFTVGDDNYWEQKTAAFKLKRYGYGAFNINVGNGVGFDGHSRGGTAILSLADESTKSASPFVGLDFANIWGRLDTNTNSYYGWAPGFSVGPQIDFGGTRLLMVARGGGYAGNLNMGTFWPSFRWMYGWGALLNNPRFNVNLDVLYFNENYIRSADLWVHGPGNTKVGLHGEDTGNIQTIGLMLKADFL
jgi:hypothetical protein